MNHAPKKHTDRANPSNGVKALLDQALEEITLGCQLVQDCSSEECKNTFEKGMFTLGRIIKDMEKNIEGQESHVNRTQKNIMLDEAQCDELFEVFVSFLFKTLASVNQMKGETKAHLEHFKLLLNQTLDQLAKGGIELEAPLLPEDREQRVREQFNALPYLIESASAVSFGERHPALAAAIESFEEAQETRKKLMECAAEVKKLDEARKHIGNAQNYVADALNLSKELASNERSPGS